METTTFETDSPESDTMKPDVISSQQLAHPSDSQSRLAWLYALGIAAVFGSIFFQWYFARQNFPDEPISVTTLYRSRRGDIEYYPLIAKLSRGLWHDNTIKEEMGRNLHSFPNLTISVHSICFKFLGAWGFAAADLIISCLYLWLAYCFFRLLRMNHIAAFLTSVFLTLRVPRALSEFGFPEPCGIFSNIWRSRLPRPFVAELMLVFALVATLRLLKAKEPHRYRHWLLLGLAYGLPLYGDLHIGIILALSSPLLLILLKQMPLRQFIRGALVSCIPFGLLLVPFCIRRVLEHPDIPVRWGVFPVDRFAPLVITEDLGWSAAAAAFFAVVLSTIGILHWRTGSERLIERHGFETRSIAYLAVLILIAFYAGTLSCVLLGKTVQIYQFSTRARTLLAYSLLLCTVMGVDLISFQLIKRLPKLSFLRSKSMAAFLVLAMSGLSIAHSATKATTANKVGHVRGVFNYLDHLTPSYRQSLAELTVHLNKNIPDGKVLASFDQSVFAWWLTYRNGYYFLAEPFVASVTDQEVETRLMMLCKLIGMSTDEFDDFINIYSVNLYWFSMGKYQATKAYTFSTIDDYTPEQQAAIERSTVRFPWQIAIPQSELRRLRAAYDATILDFDSRQLDVIVLTNESANPAHHNMPGEGRFQPPSDQWKKSFENDVFRVFVRN